MSSAGSQTLVQIGYTEWAKHQDIGADFKVRHGRRLDVVLSSHDTLYANRRLRSRPRRYADAARVVRCVCCGC